MKWVALAFAICIVSNTYAEDKGSQNQVEVTIVPPQAPVEEGYERFTWVAVWEVLVKRLQTTSEVNLGKYVSVIVLHGDGKKIPKSEFTILLRTNRSAGGNSELCLDGKLSEESYLAASTAVKAVWEDIVRYWPRNQKSANNQK